MPPQHWLYTIPLRLRSLFRRDQVEQELDAELRDHLENPRPSLRVARAGTAAAAVAQLTESWPPPPPDLT